MNDAAKKELMPDLKPCPLSRFYVLDEPNQNGERIYQGRLTETEFLALNDAFNRAEPPCDDARGDLQKVDDILRQYEIQDGGHEAYCARQLLKPHLRPAPISVEVLEGMKREWSGSFVLCEKSAARGYNAALDDVKAIIAKLRGE